MPIVIKTIDGSEYAVSGEWTLKDFLSEYVRPEIHHLTIDVQEGRNVVPTYILFEKVISIQDQPTRQSRAIDKPRGL